MAPDPGAEPDAEAGTQAAEPPAQADAAHANGAHANGAQAPSEKLAAGQAAAEQAPDQEAPDDEDPPKKPKRSFWRDLIVIVVAALALTIVLKAYVVQVFSIPSGSMENTLLPGDRILVNKLVYHFRSITRGDVVVFSGAGSWDAPTPQPSNAIARIWDDATNLVGISAPGTDYIKRVIGIPGDQVVCCDAQHQITVNGVPLSESSYVYPGDAPSAESFSITVPPGRLWVMGDNRADSDDSRFRQNSPGGGTIPESAVVGRAFVIIWPLSRVNDLPIPNTFKQAGFSVAAAVATAPPAAVGGSAVAAGTAFAWVRSRRRRRRD